MTNIDMRTSTRTGSRDEQWLARKIERVQVEERKDVIVVDGFCMLGLIASSPIDCLPSNEK